MIGMLNGTDLGLITGLINAKGGGGGGGGVTPAEVREIAREEAQTAAENKVDKVAGKGLSTEDYTTAEKEKLSELENYDDTEIRGDIEEISGDVEGAKTVSGEIVTVDDAAPINAQSVIVDIEPYQEGSGDPSPSNERPIHGWNECKITGDGKNLLNYNAWKGIEVVRGTSVFENNGITITATQDDAYTRYTPGTISYDLFYKVTPMQSVTLSWDAVSDNIEGYAYIFAFDSNYQLIQSFYAGKNRKQLSIIVPNNAEYIIFRLGVSKANTTISYNDIQLEFGSTATDYEPYQSTDYIIDFGETIYGGRLDVTKGEMVVEKAIVDLGSLEWNMISSGIFKNNALKRKYAYGVYSIVCSKYATYKNAHSTDANISTLVAENGDMIYVNSGSYTFFIADSSYSDAETFKAAMNGVQLVYELATPYTIKLTPQQIKLLENTNTLYADCGDIELKYQPNNALGKALEVAEIGYDAQIEYIKNNYLPISEIAPVENGDTASTSYAVDDYLCRGNKLYKVISAIAQGATFTDNNIQKTTVMAEILSRL